MNKKYLMTLDEGTTSARTLIIDEKGQIVSTSQLEFSQYFPQSGWVEHDPIEILNTQLTTLKQAKHKAKIKSTDLAAVGITNQRETIVVWDKTTGLPVYNAIVWQDLRTAKYCQELIKAGKEKLFYEKTGLLINPYFSGTKLRWILKNVSEAKNKLKAHKLLAGTIDSWLIWNLTKGKVHATDVTNASRTLLFNIHEQKWDQQLCDLLEIPIEILPEVKSSSEIFGEIAPEFFSNRAVGKVPIAGVAGDQQAALFGQLAFEVGDVKNTYGTGCFTLVNTGTKAIQSHNKLLTTIAWKLGNESTVYALEGSVFVAGAALQWLRDGLQIIYNAAESDFFASLVKDDQKVMVVPSFTGLGAPYWDPTSRGAILGLERGTKKEHIVKATLESIAYQSNDLIQAMAKDLKKPIKVLKVDGGAANSEYLMQFQASLSNVEVIRPQNIETTAMGAAFLAGLAVKFFPSLEALKAINKIDRKYHSQIDDAKRQSYRNNWANAIKRTQGWIDE